MNQPLAYIHPGAKIATNVVIEPFQPFITMLPLVQVPGLVLTLPLWKALE